MSRINCVEDLRQLAQRRVPRMFYDYADSGSWTEGTYRANESDFRKIEFRQRVAVNMESRSVATTMVGIDAAMPVALAPTGFTGMQHADGEILAARAAEKFGVPFTLSTMSICSIEDVAANTTKPFWFQLYVMRDRGFVERLIDRAKAARCSALMLTLDLQILGQRHKDLRNGLSAPPKPTLSTLLNLMTKPRWCLGMLGTRRRTFGNIVGHAQGVGDLSSLSTWTLHQFDPALNWGDVEWIKKRWGGKLILKGIMDAEDARLAADSGADALIVSNHGGRQLDGAPSSIRALPPIADAVGSRIEVWMDGGIRSGQDVLRAVALGARATMIGRPFLYGLGAMGEAGVTRCLEIIKNELDLTMAFCGRTQIRDVDRSILLPGTLPRIVAPVAEDTIHALRVRAVKVPMAQPHRTASGVVSESPLVLVDLETGAGIVGHSLVFTYTAAALGPLAELVANLEPLVKGQPLAPEALTRGLLARFRLLGTHGLVGMAISAIDMAAWDALARSRETALCRLLGAAPRPIPAYGGIGYDGELGSAKAAEGWARGGFKAVKAKIGYPSVDEDLAVIRAIRSAVGPDVAVMVDYNQSLTVGQAIERLARLDAEGLAWVEEPVLAEDYAGMAAVARAAHTPIQAGENWWGPLEFSKAIAAGATDCLMPDVMKAFGVTGWMDVAALAAPRRLPVSSHLFCEVSAQLLCATPTAHWLEYADWWNPVLAEPLEIREGMAIPADRPGSGVAWK